MYYKFKIHQRGIFLFLHLTAAITFFGGTALCAVPGMGDYGGRSPRNPPSPRMRSIRALENKSLQHLITEKTESSISRNNSTIFFKNDIIYLK
ncbi:MAG: hypothetical protein CVV49_10240 [Spirochaetae bacterium HGW-Spirochaetae-5]|nr:MAG: hypothetical protein CVV49_10240 [Spirochaetae bacterium HGW-Spirochaetae-5]